MKFKLVDRLKRNLFKVVQSQEKCGMQKFLRNAVLLILTIINRLQ